MKKLFLLLLLVPVAVSAGLAVYFLSSLDNIVHGTLYNYGLQFSYDWASPYWSTFRIIQLLIGSTVILSVFSFVSCLVITDRTQVQVKQTKKTKSIETMVKPEKIKPEPKTEPTFERKSVSQPPVKESRPEPPQPEPRNVEEKAAGLFRCNHCNRVFSQPLRMLDFHENQPRIISICPFCNEVIQPVMRSSENDSDKRLVFLKRRNGDEKIQVQQ